MSDKSKKSINRDHYLFLLECGVPYEGWVEYSDGKRAYALKEVVIVGKRINKYNHQYIKTQSVSVCVVDNTKVATTTQREVSDKTVEHERKRNELKKELIKKVKEYYQLKMNKDPLGTASYSLSESSLLFTITNENIPLKVSSFPSEFFRFNIELITDYMQVRSQVKAETQDVVRQSPVPASVAGGGKQKSELEIIVGIVQFGEGSASTYYTHQSEYYKYNELWHKTKTRGVSTVLNKNWKDSGAKYWRGKQIAPLKGARSLSTKIGAGGGGVLVVADIILSGEIKPSHGINAIMVGLSFTGWGSLISAGWFIADFGTMGVNYLNGDGAVSLGDIIDNSLGTYEMYEGLY